MLEKAQDIFKNASSLFEQVQAPIGSLQAAQANVVEIFKYRNELAENFKDLSQEEQALIYAEYGSNFMDALMNSAGIVRQGAAFLEENITGGELLDVSPQLASFMAVAGVFGQAIMTLKEYREYRAKRLEIDDLYLLIEDLMIELNDKYADYFQYLGVYEADEEERQKQLAWATTHLEENKSPAQLVIALQEKSLAELISHQAYAIYHDKNKYMSLAQIYQQAIDEKITQTELEKVHDSAMLKQLVLGQQHLNHLDVAGPLLNKNKQHQKLRVILGLVAVGVAVVVAVASFGVLAPAVGAAFIVAAGLIGSFLAWHKQYLTKKQNEVMQVKTPVETEVEKYLANETSAFYSLYGQYDELEAVTRDLIESIESRNDQLTRPLLRLINEKDFKAGDNIEKLFQIKNEIQAVKEKSNRWEKFSLEHHELYALIEKLDFNDVDKAKDLIKEYKDKQRIQRARQARRQGRGRPSLRADAKLATNISVKTVDEEDRLEVARTFNLSPSPMRPG